MNPKDKWFNYAITDSALFHVTMLHAVMHYGLTHGEVGREAEALALKSEVISLVNRKLADPTEGINDLTIGVVANLVLFEVRAWYSDPVERLKLMAKDHRTNRGMLSFRVSICEACR